MTRYRSPNISAVISTSLASTASEEMTTVVVGRVTDIPLEPQTYQAHVTMQMDSRFHFPKDSSLKIMTAGLLGEQYLGMEPGADTEELEDGGKIEMTQSAIVLENLISQFLYGQAGKGQEKGEGGAQ